ncbi:MAG: [protein-PII] uridylyltransferase [Gammaproteobacteria bacterium]|nr:[protein-PII] uridylyltransferase [Gammaproteobacteria bacterium]
MPISRIFDSNALDKPIPDRAAAIPVFRDALNKGSALLKERFNKGNLFAHEAVTQLAWLVDQVLIKAWHQCEWPDSGRLALIAVGGYGRRELHPGSDIDLLILYESVLDAEAKTCIESFVTFLWDIGLEVGHSVRNPAECQSVAKQDITVMTNLMEARLLTGSGSLLQDMQRKVSPEHIWLDKDFFEAKVREQEQRHHKYHDTAYNLEPNIKESPGGLRDVQTIGWVAKRHFDVDTLHDLVLHKFLTEDEYNALFKAQELLWDIRWRLHDAAGRREDRLSFDYQRPLAAAFGYTDAGQRLGVENFMKQYYRTAMEITSLSKMLLQLFQEAILTIEPSRLRPLNRRFQVRNDFIEVTHDKVFEYYPFALLEIFLLLQQNPSIKGIRATTVRLIRRCKHLIDKKFHEDLRARSLFFEIIRQPRGHTVAFRYMNRYGILAAYIPAFDKIVGQMQYDLFHVYTVDQHTLFVIRNLRRFALIEYSNEFPLCSEIMQRLPKPELLYLAGLFHDIAKGRGGDHSKLGEIDTMRFCLAHGLNDWDARFTAWLVRNHLSMSLTAQRRDISNPDVINAFARRVMDTQHLDYLYLLTVADIRGTSPTLWNGWKDTLLADLYRKTRFALQKGLDRPIDKTQRVHNIKTLAQTLLDTQQTARVAELWDDINDDYFLRSSPTDIVRETQAILAGPPSKGKGLVLLREDTQGGARFMIYTPDKDYLLANTVFYLERQSVSVMDAYISITKKGFALTIYTVLEEDGGSIGSRTRLEEIRSALEEAITWDTSQYSPIKRRSPRTIKHFPVPTRVTFGRDPSHDYTLMEVITTDRPGVLSAIARALMNCNMRIKDAKVGTFGSRVDDIFLITDRNDQALDQPDQFDCLREQLASLDKIHSTKPGRSPI